MVERLHSPHQSRNTETHRNAPELQKFWDENTARLATEVRNFRKVEGSSPVRKHVVLHSTLRQKGDLPLV